ncbi:hypothetical protein APR04_003775 [Promicromonospora umidemergens]|uniref:Uncharacterized protein n=1 Tax=Promicromonospora umidemergens TaxID=629679 RepID=A0ABP8XFS7_9MICO|nr:hypothetical protein [Promicromonospora umidemergens]MCP2284852.1 hypothetical protein [Promicromonospora umidemergens]
MSLNHRPPRGQVPEQRLHDGFRARLARGGQPLVALPLQDLLPRPRRFRPARFLYLARRIVIELLLGTVLGLVSAAVVVGRVGHEMGWI